MKQQYVFVDGLDFTPFIVAESYETTPEPVIAWESKTLDGTTRKLVSGVKWMLRFRLQTLDLSKYESKSVVNVLRAAASRGYAAVSFQAVQPGVEKEIVASLDSASFGKLLEVDSGDGIYFTRGAEIVLREL